MIEFLDLPKYLSEHGNKEKDVKIVCILDRQIEMPEHLKSISDSSNMAALVDVVGIDIQGKKYIMKGLRYSQLIPILIKYFIIKKER